MLIGPPRPQARPLLSALNKPSLLARSSAAATFFFAGPDIRAGLAARPHPLLTTDDLKSCMLDFKKTNHTRDRKGGCLDFFNKLLQHKFCIKNTYIFELT